VLVKFATKWKYHNATPAADWMDQDGGWNQERQCVEISQSASICNYMESACSGKKQHTHLADGHGAVNNS
jgi:hypothetical protein